MPLDAKKAAIARRLWALREAEMEADQQPKAAPSDQLVDAAEAGRILGLSAHAVRQMAWRGTVKCVRIGRRLRFKRSELAKLGR